MVHESCVYGEGSWRVEAARKLSQNVLRLCRRRLKQVRLGAPALEGQGEGEGRCAGIDFLDHQTGGGTIEGCSRYGRSVLRTSSALQSGRAAMFL